MYTSDNDTSAKSCLHNRPSGGPPSSQMDRKGVRTILVHIFEAQTTPMPRTGEIHEMKPNKTGETVIHLEVYSSIHTVYLPTRGDRASMRDTAIQHDTAIHLYNAIQCIGCITTPQVKRPKRSINQATTASPFLSCKCILHVRQKQGE